MEAVRICATLLQKIFQCGAFMQSKDVLGSIIVVLSLASKHAEMPGSKSETQHTVNIWDGLTRA